MAAPATLTTEEVLSQLQILTQGLYYQSEADYPLEVVSFDATITNELTQEEILTLTGKTPGEPVEVMETSTFFRHFNQVNSTTNQEVSSATNAQALQFFLEQNVQNMKVYRMGKRTISALLVGKTATGNWIGLQTTIIET
ncbi:nuclease A inhibitor family protein [Adhaeribacter radiodurans]|uniref:Nuclease n=1 Tax=Adhaeribacter radiodurans TaxID=2745197 RepID=A0A7L7LCJ7_9BACT|nr:nuclease A inhibitor family protein [Adhaeribacter radiodurans]QMU30541.1 hypothetical protein HUW48_22060 [Adhaeribacter radiodurans]